MKKHILLTVSDDFSALQAVRFVAHFFAKSEHLEITLLYVAHNPKSGLTEAEIIKDYGNLNKREAQTKEHAQSALNKAEELLVNKYFPKTNIHKKITFKQLGTASDIIQEGISGMYDAIALGRRGLSRLEELLADSVSKQIFTTPMEIPLWICRNQDKPGPNVLLCTDGSPASLRCADHVGYMLRNEPLHEVTILHVCTGSEAIPSAQALADAKRLLMENGMVAERIREKVIEGHSVNEVVLKVAKEGHYGVVATGRTGRGETRSMHLLGSVSMNMLKHLDFATLWISH